MAGPESDGEGDVEVVDMDAKKLEERLKSALWFNIGKMVDSETINLNVNATPQFIGSLTELVWTQIESAATDLQSFASHAKRSTIQIEDVMLLARRNEGLEGILREFVDTKLVKGKSMSKDKSEGNRTKRKEKGGIGKKIGVREKGKGKEKKKKESATRKARKQDDEGDEDEDEEDVSD